ncbi:transcription factor HBP-1b(c1) [Artemisia annua]|uniref:Transcription factor HBP-1b(C1) n=1 Tax=Artemisia annua TaxID=35608 RepID=A0A2U1QH64_ARTAN|nr:transcription factor HBP-1b(c1) [Artemisia annua]
MNKKNRGDETGRNDTGFTDLGELQHYDAVDLSRSSVYNERNAAVVINNNNNALQFRPHHHMNFGSGTEMSSIGTGVDTGQFMMHHHNKSAIADNSQQTDTSTDIDTDDKNQFNSGQHGGQIVVDSMEGSMGKIGDPKAYVQQLESSRIKLTHLEQELKRARQQGMFIAAGASGDHNSVVGGNGALAFDMDYSRWLDDHQRLINDLRSAVNTQIPDNELRILVEAVMSHYDEIFRLKSIATKSDVFHMLSGMWKTPAERCFLWIGGFRSSEILKMLGNHLEPLTDQQLMGICNLQQSSQQAEDALSQGMEALQQSLVDTLSVGFTSSGNVGDYMGQMAIAMGKITTLENFLHQADLLRQQTLQQLHRILTTRQSARAFLVISDYMSRLRALSSLWLARPKD